MKVFDFCVFIVESNTVKRIFISVYQQKLVPLRIYKRVQLKDWLNYVLLKACNPTFCDVFLGSKIYMLIGVTSPFTSINNFNNFYSGTIVPVRALIQ